MKSLRNEPAIVRRICKYVEEREETQRLEKEEECSIIDSMATYCGYRKPIKFKHRRNEDE
jgi:hypothetical protein